MLEIPQKKSMLDYELEYYVIHPYKPEIISEIERISKSLEQRLGLFGIIIVRHTKSEKEIYNNISVSLAGREVITYYPTEVFGYFERIIRTDKEEEYGITDLSCRLKCKTSHMYDSRSIKQYEGAEEIYYSLLNIHPKNKCLFFAFRYLNL